VTVGDPLSSNGGLHAINKEIGKAQLRMAQETSPTDSPTVLTVCEILFITGALPKNPRIRKNLRFRKNRRVARCKDGNYGIHINPLVRSPYRLTFGLHIS